MDKGLISDTLSQQSIESALTTRWLARPVIYLPAVGSTNYYLQQLNPDQTPAGIMVITDYQFSGRGRLGRRWEAPAGSSLLFSLLFRPGWPASQAHWLTMIAGLAVTTAVQAETGLTMGLKWPNDVMCRVDERWYKVGGLLLAASLTGDQLDHAVMGIGLNVNISTNELPETITPATSLQMAAGRKVPRLPLLVSILQGLEALYMAADQGISPQPAWNDRLILTGRRITITMREGSLTGIMEGTDAEGQLLVRDEKGKLWAFPAGDVTLRE